MYLPLTIDLNSPNHIPQPQCRSAYTNFKLPSIKLVCNVVNIMRQNGIISRSFLFAKHMSKKHIFPHIRFREGHPQKITKLDCFSCYKILRRLKISPITVDYIHHSRCSKFETIISPSPKSVLPRLGHHGGDGGDAVHHALDDGDVLPAPLDPRHVCRGGGTCKAF